MTKTNKIIDKMDHNFVDNYEDMIKYQQNLNEILYKMGFSGFDSYNDFCKILRKNALDKIKKEKIQYLDTDTDFFSLVINKTLRDKIRENKDYTDKLIIYFNDKNIVDIMKKDPYVN